MKRFLNKARSVTIEPLVSGYERKFKLASGQTAVENEILVGSYSGNTYLFIYKNSELFAFTHDDFTYDFLRVEELALDAALSDIQTDVNSLDTTNKLVVEDTGGVV